jgi:hypothetical protein
VFGVDLDRFQDQVQFIGAVDFPKHTVDMVWRDDLGFGEVIEAIDPVGMQVFHDENRALAAFVPREQRQVVGAEVKHERWLPVAREKRVWVIKSAEERKSERGPLSPPPQRR